jgi:hypothetical protein
MYYDWRILGRTQCARCGLARIGKRANCGVDSHRFECLPHHFLFSFYLFPANFLIVLCDQFPCTLEVCFYQPVMAVLIALPFD